MIRDTADPTRILLYELWPDRESYMGPHMETPHIKAFKAQAGELFAGEVEVRVLGGEARKDAGDLEAGQGGRACRRRAPWRRGVCRGRRRSPSHPCGQKRTLLLGEYLADDLLIGSPHRRVGANEVRDGPFPRHRWASSSATARCPPRSGS